MTKCLLRGVLAVLLIALAGCAGRPTASVLRPVPIAATESGKHVSLLFATNRAPAVGGGYTGQRDAKITYGRFELAFPATHVAGQIEYPSSPPNPAHQIVATSRSSLSTAAFLQALSEGQMEGTVGVFVPGYNYSFQEGLFRLAQVAADADAKTMPIVFSWPSQGEASAYLADKDANLASRDALTSLLRMVASRPNIRRVVLFGHSMGGFLIMETARQLKLQGRHDVLDKLTIVLAAPDIDADLFRSQLEVIGDMKEPITLLVSNDDGALRLSSLLAGKRPRIGRLEVSNPTVAVAASLYHLRVIDITSLEDSDPLGHDRFAALPQYATQLGIIEQSGGGSLLPSGTYTLASENR